MISMVRFAIMVLMAFRDLRFLSTVFLAHFTRLISLFLFQYFYFLVRFRFSKNREVQTRHQDSLALCAHFVRDHVNWLFLVVTTVIVYELPLTNENPVPEPE